MMYVAVFCVSFFVNFFYAMYVKSINENKLLKAAIYGECIVGAGALITINYVHNHWFLVPSLIGGFVGTLLTHKICSLLNIKN